MAGHSKWANIQHRKGRQDAARSKLFSKLSKEITVAAKSSAVPVTRIGSMIERPGVHVIGPGGVSLDLSIDGFRHF